MASDSSYQSQSIGQQIRERAMPIFKRASRQTSSKDYKIFRSCASKSCGMASIDRWSKVAQKARQKMLGEPHCLYEGMFNMWEKLLNSFPIPFQILWEQLQIRTSKEVEKGFNKQDLRVVQKRMADLKIFKGHLLFEVLRDAFVARVEKVRKIFRRHETWNLATETGFVFVNGILVTQCDALRYALLQRPVPRTHVPKKKRPYVDGDYFADKQINSRGVVLPEITGPKIGNW